MRWSLRSRRRSTTSDCEGAEIGAVGTSEALVSWMGRFEGRRLWHDALTWEVKGMAGLASEARA